MNRNKLDGMIKYLRKTHKERIDNLKKDYLIANNTKNIGDIVSDEKGSIVIEEIGYYLGEKYCCVFTGHEVLPNGIISIKNKRHIFDTKESFIKIKEKQIKK